MAENDLTLIKKKINALIVKGKSQGYVTYGDIDNAIPNDYEEFDSTLLEGIYETLEKENIEIHDEGEENSEEVEVYDTESSEIKKIPFLS
jgi:hypothetical protein